jgi:hypothetical protein
MLIKRNDGQMTKLERGFKALKREMHILMNLKKEE